LDAVAGKPQRCAATTPYSAWPNCRPLNFIALPSRQGLEDVSYARSSVSAEHVSD
jgi:hypothetical protein